MIDEYSLDGTGWARFSDDRRHRYRLGRLVNPGMKMEGFRSTDPGVVFLMLNPSTADAFKRDQTVGKCCKFAARWGVQVLEVVNLFSFRTPYPTDLFKQTDAGDDGANDEQILEACTRPGVQRVIAAWGNHGDWRDRDKYVRNMLTARGIDLWHLGMTSGEKGAPMHPLARGKFFIPLEREPQRLS